MIIEIRQHAEDTAMYEFWQLDKVKPKYLMAVVHGDVLEQDIMPDTFEKNRMQVIMVAYEGAMEDCSDE